MDLVEARARRFEVGARHPWERARLRLTARLIRSHVALRAGDVVLDVGCGDTFVAEGLARLHPGVMFFAVDSAFSDDLLRTFTERLTVPNVRLFTSLDEVPDAVPASLVLLMDVIEHVPDDLAFLQDVCGRPCVSPGAHLLITVPAYQPLFCSHDRALGHYRRYSSRTLGTLLARARLTPVEQGNFFASLVPLRLAQVVSERVSPPRADASQVAGWNGSEAVGRVLASVLSVDGRIGLLLGRAGLRLPGLSTYAVCRTSA
jgi:2-polyprenyl-3-methyl-5-hydroxy-6-metoxy-1,4-benzoquinol methylase